MKVFVAGAGGALGRPLVARLVAAGHDVTAMTRSPAKREALHALGARPVICDALDAEAVGRAVREASPEVVVHQLTALPAALDPRRFDQQFAQTNRLRTEGTDHLLSAARAAGVRRFVAQSFAGWPYARTGGAVKTEDDPLEPDPAPAFRSTLAAIRHLEDAVTGADWTEGIALRYGGFYGPGSGVALEPLGELVVMIRKRRFPVIGDGGGVWSWIHVDDAAAATVAAIERGTRGIYNVVDDDPAAVREWLPALADAVGARPPRRIPRLLGRMLAGAAATVMMTEVRGATNGKAKRELGWSPSYASWRRGFVEGLR